MSVSLAQWSALVGTLLPLLVAVVQQHHYPNWVRAGIGVAACVIASAVTAYLEGKLNLRSWSESALVVFTLTKTTYLSVWKPSGITGTVEAATSTPPAEPAA